MKEWSRTERYRKIEDVFIEEYEALLHSVEKARWRQKFHVQPVSGLLNDPNGLVQKGDTYHIFFQWFPLGAVHGLKYWYHASSKDLIEFKYEGAANIPDTTWESHGAYSGSALLHEEDIQIFYTGNHRSEDWNRTPYQIRGVFNEETGVVEEKEPVIEGPHPGYTEHYRDPKVWRHEDTFYMIVGAQTTGGRGCVVLYHSKDLKEWRFHAEVKTGLADFGYMWECPDMFNLNGYDVLLFSPQGIANDTGYLNVYQSGCIVGQFDYETAVMDHDAFHLMDYGYDFYAPQTFENSSGERILIGWMGLPETGYPSDEDGWAHCLTIPRKLSIENGRLFQEPIPQLMKYRKAHDSRYKGSKIVDLPETYDLEVNVRTMDDFTLCLLDSGDEYFEITYSSSRSEIQIRRHFNHEVECRYPEYRKAALEEPVHHLRAIVDVSSIELFINHGKYVFTSRMFSEASTHDISAHNISLDDLNIYELEVE
ncbi:sucrose-6-phosphate hydrolase [Salinicoccus cyprini]|jgi:beta-fructofuranosidase|uniref:Sucrose-6-phosphate hydrolase n=1 Tax=Salinicoccus cyprini TaxID=2493691 RepID=A0A558ARC3_9STAP|nr:sucrose-6-phosphate hydrolase [Salinicoccus cyprini]TVT26800.1 sucrose-6-phosphate hydrolase [Salinicoccus cyprini]